MKEPILDMNLKIRLQQINEQIELEQIKMFLFARWIATCYADTHLDSNMKSEHDEGFKKEESISVLNREDGQWYKKQLEFFNQKIFPVYIKNGNYNSTKELLFPEDKKEKHKTEISVEEEFININELLPDKGRDIIGKTSPNGEIAYVFRCNCHMKNCKEWRCSLTGGGMLVQVYSWKYAETDEEFKQKNGQKSK